MSSTTKQSSSSSNEKAVDTAEGAAKSSANSANSNKCTRKFKQRAPEDMYRHKRYLSINEQKIIDSKVSAFEGHLFSEYCFKKFRATNTKNIISKVTGFNPNQLSGTSYHRRDKSYEIRDAFHLDESFMRHLIRTIYTQNPLLRRLPLLDISMKLFCSLPIMNISIEKIRNDALNKQFNNFKFDNGNGQIVDSILADFNITQRFKYIDPESILQEFANWEEEFTPKIKNCVSKAHDNWKLEILLQFSEMFLKATTFTNDSITNLFLCSTIYPLLEIMRYFALSRNGPIKVHHNFPINLEQLENDELFHGKSLHIDIMIGFQNDARLIIKTISGECLSAMWDFKHRRSGLRLKNSKHFKDLFLQCFALNTNYAILTDGQKCIYLNFTNVKIAHEKNGKSEDKIGFNLGGVKYLYLDGHTIFDIDRTIGDNATQDLSNQIKVQMIIGLILQRDKPSTDNLKQVFGELTGQQKKKEQPAKQKRRSRQRRRN